MSIPLGEFTVRQERCGKHRVGWVPILRAGTEARRCDRPTPEPSSVEIGPGSSAQVPWALSVLAVVNTVSADARPDVAVSNDASRSLSAQVDRR